MVGKRIFQIQVINFAMKEILIISKRKMVMMITIIMTIYSAQTMWASPARRPRSHDPSEARMSSAPRTMWAPPTRRGFATIKKNQW
jgi:hypothetical protein